jgi:sec-independent protein translocase protein TatB
VFDINGGEFLILIVVALVVLGPERLPQYAQQLGRLVREARGLAMKAREQVRSEMGDEFDDVDWKALDPRQYDPRRIVREALLDGDDDLLGLKDFNDPQERTTSSSTASSNGTSPSAPDPDPLPSTVDVYDDDAT